MLAVDTNGLHPTTETCIALLQELHDNHTFHNILDMGCGNGILSLVAGTIWDAQVLAVDISPNALAAAEENIAAHGLGEYITALHSDGFKHRIIDARAPYDLIMCNLVAELLVKMALDIKKNLAPDGFCVLSGMLAWLEEPVKTACQQLNLVITKRNNNGEWVTYLLRHAPLKI